MTTSIEGFVKTEHFMYRQWDRSIPDEILTKALKKIEKPRSKTTLIISHKLFKDFLRDKKSELIVVVAGKTLITCFFCSINEFYQKHRTGNYRIVQ